MTWRLQVRHTTGYEYERPVLASYNEARMTPVSTERQSAVEAELTVQPGVRVSRYWDYWGTLVHAFDIHAPHERLVVTASSVVDTNDHAGWTASPASWDALTDEATTDRFYEFLAMTPATRADAELAEVARGMAAQAATPEDAAGLVLAWVRDHLAYEKGSTSVSTSALEAWRAGAGVCQDFVHLTLALLRAMGIPCRYVSGYFYSRADAVVGETIHGESHAWVEMWIGEWRPLDPTNALAVGERHVLVARGRDYGDVTPLKGVYSGAPPSTPTVSVELTRLE